MIDPLIKFLPFQQAAFQRKDRFLFLLWARQRGKSYYLAALAMLRMIRLRGHSVFVINASILMGGENILKEALIWQEVLDKYREIVTQQGQLLQITGFQAGQMPDIDAIQDLFQSAKLEAKIWHSNTLYSRTRVVSPNPLTARGYTGDCLLDEAGFFQDFRGTYDAVEPIIARNPRFILRMVTTPPMDDSHPTFGLLKPPSGMEFAANAEGNWYKTEQGIPVHRVDIFDSVEAGLPLFDRLTGAPVDPLEARKTAIDRVSHRRNYELYFASGGAAALSRESILFAQDKGAHFHAVDLLGEELVA